MSTKLKVTVIVSSLAILLFTIVGGFVNVRASSNEGAYRQLSVYSEVLSRIRLEYVEEPNIAGVTDGALHGLLESLDANSSYLSAEEYKHYKAMKSGGKADIGATVSKRSGYAAVVAAIPGGPADKAGIENSDYIESIEGKSTHEMSLAEIRALLSGEVGSTITLAVVRPRRAEPQKIVITRDIVAIPPASEKMLADNVGYIQVDAFPEGKAQEIAGKIADLQKQGAKKLVLDLRNSAGGVESEGVATANLFLDHGTITYLLGQKIQRRSRQGHHQASGGGAGESRHGWSGRDCGLGHFGECARRRGWRQDLRRRLGAKTDRDAGQLRSDSFDREVLLAKRKGNSRCVGDAECAGR
jgi:carboxyl-terminal processing protease